MQLHRKHHHNEISFGLVYAFDENFILPISHDEVVHGKGSMIARMPGDAWQQFANLRAYYGFMWAHPGKKLLFMGCEFAQGPEWNFEKALEWHQLDIHWHAQVQSLVKDLNNVYQNTPALYQNDCENQGFSWLDYENSEQSVFSFIRYGEEGTAPVVVVCNFANHTYQDFRVGVPQAGTYQERLNTDAEVYGGNNQGNLGAVESQHSPFHNQEHSMVITVPALSTLIFSLAD